MTPTDTHKKRKNITIRMTIKSHLEKEIISAGRATERTLPNSRAYWLGYKDALVELKNKYFKK